MKQTYFCPLDHFGSVSLAGPDAHKFLQGQITCDLDKVSRSQVQAGACCTPKGNVIANFVLLTHADTLLMHMPLSIVETVQKAMAKYIVFSNAKLKDASANWCRFAVWGATAKACIEQAFGAAPNDPLHSVSHADRLVWTNDKAGDAFVVYCHHEAKAKLITDLEQLASLVDTAQWEARQINQGLVYITPDISDSYVPQMLNLQATGAVDFKKGCYTGQEIVARMQYLGKLKRHLFIGQVSSLEALQVGQQIDATKRKNVGRVTSVAALGEHSYCFTAVINRTEAQEEPLHLNEHDNSAITLSVLPYEIDPQVFERIKL